MELGRRKAEVGMWPTPRRGAIGAYAPEGMRNLEVGVRKSETGMRDERHRAKGIALRVRHRSDIRNAGR